MSEKTKKKMNWSNLNDGKCPKCSGPIKETKNKTHHACSVKDCFAINNEKLKTMLVQMSPEY